MLTNQFPNQLKKLRTKRGWSLTDMATKFKKQKSRQVVSNYEKGSSYPSIADLFEIAQLFDVGFDELLTGIEPIGFISILSEPALGYLPEDMAKLQSENEILKTQNNNLIRELSMTRTTVKSLETIIEMMKANLEKK